MNANWKYNWSDWENLVWEKLEKIEKRVATLETFRWKLIGGSLALVGFIELISQLVRIKGAM
jgi:hypothetical protein